MKEVIVEFVDAVLCSKSNESVYKTFPINMSILYDTRNVLCGFNGCGKSTLVHFLAGHPSVELVSGEVLFKGEDITQYSPDQRAKKGMFLSFQNPVVIDSVITFDFLRFCFDSKRKEEKKESLPVHQFLAHVKELCSELEFDYSLLKRPLNYGFSGGEKKRLEMLQMLLLKPSFVIFDETDSGLDVDSIKIIQNVVHRLSKEEKTIFLIITHNFAFARNIAPSQVYLMRRDRLDCYKDPSILLSLERHGLKEYLSG